MKHRSHSLLVACVVAAALLPAGFAGCTQDSTGGPDPIEKSAKRGLAGNVTAAGDLEVLKSGVSWWYNWGVTTGAPNGFADTYEMDFIPMLWGRNSDASIESARDYILSRPEIEYLLVMNEPNLTGQANRLPWEAAVDWLKYEDLVAELAANGRTIKTVGPQITWGTMQGYADPVVWMDAFYDAYRTANGGRDPQIDYLGFHWYDYGLEGQLDRLQKYGKQIWITEMANWNANIDSYEKHIEQMTQMVALCESRADVFRYAWFIARGTTFDNHHTYVLTQNTGELTELGRAYLDLPF